MHFRSTMRLATRVYRQFIEDKQAKKINVQTGPGSDVRHPQLAADARGPAHVASPPERPEYSIRKSYSRIHFESG